MALIILIYRDWLLSGGINPSGRQASHGIMAPAKTTLT
jgi:hypothetical protein